LIAGAGGAMALRVEVAYAGPEGEAIVAVDVPDDATLADAVVRSGLAERFGLFAAALGYAIHGQRALASTPLRAGDRIELLRPLVADPREARKRRARSHPIARPPPRKKTPRGR